MSELGGRLSKSKQWFLIAEIGVNHENSMEIAKKMIKDAAENGASAAKFQTYKAGKLAIKESPSYWDTEKEPSRNQFELFSKFDSFDNSEYIELAHYAKSCGIEFMSTAFDLESLEWIDPLVEIHKIASADITNIPLIRAIASKGKPVCLSTGAASFEEIDTAVNELKTYGNGEISLLHCVLNYPCPDENAFLGRIQELAMRYPGIIMGYSDHTIPDTESLAVIAAYSMGARVIEKHFTHDKSLQGNDHYHAMDSSDLNQLCARLSQVGAMNQIPSETEFLESQQAAIVNARRSIVTSRKIKAGEKLTEENLTTKRPASGLSPLNWDKLIGRLAKEDFPKDFLISFKDTLDDGE